MSDGVVWRVAVCYDCASYRHGRGVAPCRAGELSSAFKPACAKFKKREPSTGRRRK